MKKKIESLIKKYGLYVYNLNWHITTNNPEGFELIKCKENLERYKEMLADLKSLTS